MAARGLNSRWCVCLGVCVCRWLSWAYKMLTVNKLLANWRVWFDGVNDYSEIEVIEGGLSRGTYFRLAWYSEAWLWGRGGGLFANKQPVTRQLPHGIASPLPGPPTSSLRAFLPSGPSRMQLWMGLHTPIPIFSFECVPAGAYCGYWLSSTRLFNVIFIMKIVKSLQNWPKCVTFEFQLKKMFENFLQKSKYITVSVMRGTTVLCTHCRHQSWLFLGGTGAWGEVLAWAWLQGGLPA